MATRTRDHVDGDASGEPLGHFPENCRRLPSSPDLDGHPVGTKQRVVGLVGLEQRRFVTEENFGVAGHASSGRRILGGEKEVRKNWGTLLRSVTDFRTEVRTIAAEGDIGLIEHDWSGTRLDGTRLHLRGVNVFGLRNGRFAWGRIYMESVEAGGIDLDERVRRMVEGDAARKD